VAASQDQSDSEGVNCVDTKRAAKSEISSDEADTKPVVLSERARAVKRLIDQSRYRINVPALADSLLRAVDDLEGPSATPPNAEKARGS